jgi:hypothetical protein
MFKFILHFILIFLFLNLVENTDDVNEYLVETKYGTIRGYPLPIEDKEINVKVFLGIPYAKAPINELRFEVEFGIITSQCFVSFITEAIAPKTMEWSEECDGNGTSLLSIYSQGNVGARKRTQ